MAQKRDKVRPDSVHFGMIHLVVQYGRIPLYAGRVATLVGLEPTIPGLGGQCLIHWATGAVCAVY